jgi:hypothetical protein
MKWKHVLRYPFDIRLAKKILSDEPAREPFDLEHPNIGLDLYTDQLLLDCGRHLACLAANAATIQSPIVLRCSRLMLAAIAHKLLGPMFLAMPNVRWIHPSQPFPSRSLVLMDVDRGQSDRVLTGQRTVAMVIGRDAVERTMVMPYPMHPDQIAGLDRQALESLRAEPKAGVFFAGNQKSRYGRESLVNEFGVLPRLEVLSTLRRHYPDRIASRQADGVSDRIVLRNSATDPIAKQDWMATIASHQFFLCCPGSSQPVCHNAMEAMAAGTIPIIEYADRMHPRLRDGVNAVCFRGREGLINAIERIDRMSAQQRQDLSTNVSEYFDEHLDGGRFMKRLRDELNTDFVDCVSMPFHDRNLFSPAFIPSGRVPIRHESTDSARVA